MQMMAASLARQGDIAFQSNLYVDPNATRRGLHCKRRDWVMQSIMRHVAPQSTVLEVGIGCGVFTRFLSMLGTRATAVDINPEFVQDVTGLPGVSAVLADATLPLGLGEHDLVVCSEVLEHVPADRSVAMLRELRDALAPHGRLILTTPQKYSTLELAARLLKFGPILRIARRLYGSADELGHINLLRAGELRRQLASVGLAIESETRFGLYLPLIAEFGGDAGRRLLERTERLIRDVPYLRALIWTQAYILKRA